ncbi:hypothetical protein LX73_0334 [Fodinibius salinus]|uniref:Uncharacterized protein n=1 Tax=Fodinibius salinus TaxID=860790 RepID=A0A5D3YPR9_9BACT|nr:hypothetical protein [Fodinibius salinus]TYP95039.1 hypothetical protein LX73_0334 [Fodinibius salinus]
MLVLQPIIFFDTVIHQHMIIGNKFSEKYHQFLIEIGKLANGDTSLKISVKDINTNLCLDRTEIKNLLEYLEELGYINIQTIGGPLLYGHISITESGLTKFRELEKQKE